MEKELAKTKRVNKSVFAAGLSRMWKYKALLIMMLPLVIVQIINGYLLLLRMSIIQKDFSEVTG